MVDARECSRLDPLAVFKSSLNNLLLDICCNVTLVFVFYFDFISIFSTTSGVPPLAS